MLLAVKVAMFLVAFVPFVAAVDIARDESRTGWSAFGVCAIATECAIGVTAFALWLEFVTL